MDLAWSAVDYIGRYQVYRKTGNNVSWVSIGTSSGTTFTDTGVTSNAHYTYAVTGMVNSVDATALSNTKDITYYAAPNVTAVTCGNGNMVVTWKQEPGIDTYRVYRSVNGGDFAPLTDVSAVSYTDTTANTAGTKYAYAVRCVKDGNLVSEWKTSMSGTYLNPPTGVTATSTTVKKVTIKWNPLYVVKSYNVLRRTATSGWTTVATGITTGSYTDTTATSGVNYIYCVVAVAADGTKSASSAETTPVTVK